MSHLKLKVKKNPSAIDLRREATGSDRKQDTAKMMTERKKGSDEII